MDALDMLTEDCWTEVFRRVKSALDLKACNETCVLFETILSRNKSSWMLGLMIPFVFNYLNLEEEQDEMEIRGEEEDSNERAKFWSPVLRTRLVSRALCHAVDTYMEKNFEREKYPYGCLPAPYYFCQENEYFPSRIDDFIQKFETHRGNPLIGRNVNIVHFHRPNDDADPEEPYNEDDRIQESMYMGKLVQVLSKFGHHIWTMKLEERNEFTTYTPLQCLFIYPFERTHSLLE